MSSHKTQPELSPSENDLLQQQDSLEQHWEIFLGVLFEKYVSYGFAPHHREFWDWVWSIQNYRSIESFIAIWSRAHGKSTSAELAVVAVAARNSRRYALYVSETQDQADKHVSDIAVLLESEEIGQYYPYLHKPRVGLYGNKSGWRRNRLITESGFIVDAVGLDTSVRGIKFESDRPDFIVLDDVDGKHDSPAVIAKKEEIITRSIIPAGARHMTVLGVQNLIHPASIFSKLSVTQGKNAADYLADRIVSGPHPALLNFKYEANANGVGHKIVSGIPTWPGADLEICQDLLTKMALPAFLAECQHDLSRVVSGALYPMWDEVRHVITRSELARAVGDRAYDHNGDPCIPNDWTLGRGHDWGTTQKHPAAVANAARPTADYPQFTKYGFVYREIVCPAFPPVNTDAPEAVWPSKIARMINDAERPHAEKRRVKISKMSHEASAALNTYLYELPPDEKIWFEKWEPDAKAGIAQTQEYLAIDWDTPHPFRVYPEGSKNDKGDDISGEPIMGCPRLFFVVEDGQGELYCDRDGKLKVAQAVDSAGLARARWEMPKQKHRTDQSGYETDKVDDKIDDDFHDALKGLLTYFLPRIAPLTAAQLAEEKLPASVQMAAINKMEDGEEKARAWTSRQIYEGRNNANKAPSNPLGFMKRSRKMF